jgi:tetratricopeptide (TPR) repeat protein
LKIHPKDVYLEEFFLSLGDDQKILLEHVAGCASCSRRLFALARRRRRPEPAAGDVAEVLRWPLAAGEYEPALEQTQQEVNDRRIVLTRERDEAPGLFVELTGVPVERREALLRAPRFHTWGLLELLVERSLETAIRNPDYAEELGFLALRLAGHLDQSYYGAGLIEDLRARAWGHIGNARRVRSDLFGAEEAFEAAYAHLLQGTRDQLERAIFLDLRASLLRAQRRFEPALRLLRRAVDLFLGSGNPHRAGRSLVNMSTVHHFAGEEEQAIPLLVRALELIDPEVEPRLLLCVRHNLIDDLAQAGRFLEAQSLYRETRPLYRDFTDAWTQNRRKWVKARISRGLGQTGVAESLFLAAREGFLAEGIPYDTALVSLELATLYAEQGRMEDLKRLAGEMMPIFSSLQIHREALAALAYFQQAVEAERASLAVVSAVAEYLRRAQHDPELRFEAPAS